MWRKQEEPKANTSPEVREQTRIEQPAPVAPAPVRDVKTPLAGHLTASLVIKGEISGHDDLFIDGEVQGKIRLEEGKLTVGPNGRVTADVEAREIVIRGRIKGNLNGRERVEISQTGCATGDVVTKRILIEDGAEMHGRVEIKRIEVRQPQAEPVQEKKKPAPAPITPVVAEAASPAAVAKDEPTPPASIKNGTEPVTTPARESAPVA